MIEPIKGTATRKDLWKEFNMLKSTFISIKIESGYREKLEYG